MIKGVIDSIDDQIFDSGRDKDFFKRVWQTPFETYKYRLENIGFQDMAYVLDAGSGFGQWTFPLSIMNGKVIGIDNSPSRIKVSKKVFQGFNKYNAEFFVEDIEATSYSDYFFDGIFCYSSIYFTDFKNTLKEFWRILKPGGKLYFSTNDVGWYFYNIEKNHNPSYNYDPQKVAMKAISNSISYFSGLDYCPKDLLVMPKELVLNYLVDIGFAVLSSGGDGKIRHEADNDVKSFYESEYHGYTNVYEVLCQKPQIKNKDI